MRTFLELLKPYRKAVLAGIVAAIFAALPLVIDGNITGPELAVIVGALLSGAGITYRVPNVPAASGARKAS